MTTSGRLILPYAEGALQNNLTFASGATLTVYVTGTTNLASLFADSDLTTPITNPQVANAAGAFYSQSTTIFADQSQGYDCILSFPDGESYSYIDIALLGAQANTSGLAPLNSPAFTGAPTAPTPATNDASAKLATTQYVQNQGYAPLANPAFTDVPTAPTPSPGTNTTQLATTAFVTTAVTNSSAQFRNQQGSGTNSGETLSTGAYRQRVLNTSVFNTIPGCSLASNQVTLPPGTYQVEAFAMAITSSGATSLFTHKIRIYDVTASTTLVPGVNTSMSATTGGTDLLVVMAVARGQFTLTGSDAVEVDSWVGAAATGGAAISSGDPEVYVDVLFTLLP